MRIDKYKACLNFRDSEQVNGNVGAGTGASVGKILGMVHAMNCLCDSIVARVMEKKVVRAERETSLLRGLPYCDNF